MKRTKFNVPLWTNKICTSVRAGQISDGAERHEPMFSHKFKIVPPGLRDLSEIVMIAYHID